MACGRSALKETPRPGSPALRIGPSCIRAGIGLFVPAIHETGRKQEEHLREDLLLLVPQMAVSNWQLAFSFLAFTELLIC
jgi:hypothetical protein